MVAASVHERGADPLVGHTLDGRYQILRRIGAGGMGAIYLARQLQFGRSVAVKLIRAEKLGDPRTVGRFLHEARASSTLHHPNVVTIHDFGRSREGMLYLVMEYLEGTPLSRLVGPGALRPAHAVSVAVQMCAGLQEAHRQGLVHCDLKPDNVMLCQAEGLGELVKLLDFGIARSVQGGSVDGTAAESGPKRAFGTPEYMSPEQARARALDGRSDIYSLGVMLFEMLSGSLPFGEASGMAAMIAHTREAPADVAETAGMPLPSALCSLVHACLEKSPDDRPQSAGALRERLKALLPALVQGDGEQMHLDAALTPIDAAVLAHPTPPPVSGALTAEAVSASEAPPWAVGDVVAERFRITALRDGSAPGTQRAVAEDVASSAAAPVVLVSASLTDPAVRMEAQLAVERWLSVLAHFRHAGVAALRAASVAAEGVELARDAVTGPTLRARMADGPWVSTDAVALVRQLCDALGALHTAGVVHQDVRPESVVLPAEGPPVLIDAGWWSLVACGAPLLPEAEAERARHYKAPEQLGAVGAPVGPEADLYALGVLLYELVTGAEPFAGADAEGLAGAKLTPAPHTAGGLRGLDDGLDAIVGRLLHPLPAERFRSTAELDAALAVLDGDTEDNSGAAPVDLGRPGPLRGRTALVEQLRGRLDALVGGRGGAVVLEGPAGVGKTRLLDRLVVDAERRLPGALVLRASTGVGGRTGVLGGLHGLLSALDAVWAGAGEQERARLAGAARTVGPLGALLGPHAALAAEVFADAPAPPPLLDTDAAAARFIQTAATFLLRLTEGGRVVCLVLDDAQQLDDASLRALELVARGAPARTLLLACAGHPGHPASARLGAEGATVLRVGPLDAAAVAAFLRDRVGAAGGWRPLESALVEVCGGHPGRMVALLRAADAGGAVYWGGSAWRANEERLGAVIDAAAADAQGDARVEQLRPSTRMVLQSAAVWGAPFDVSTVAVLTPELARAALVAAMADAERLGFLGAPVDGLRAFPPGGRRMLVLRTIDPARAAVLHRRAAKLARAESRGDAGLFRVARHLVRAEPEPGDADLLESAAVRALANFDGESAYTLADEALSRLGDDPESASRRQALEVVAARGHALTRDLPGALARYARLLDGRLPTTTRVELLAGQAALHRLAGALQRADAALSEALGLLDYRANRGPARFVAIAWRLLNEVLLRPRADQRFEGSSGGSERGRTVASLLQRRSEVMLLVDPVASFVAFLDALHHARRSGNPGIYGRILGFAGPIVGSAMGWLGAAGRLTQVGRRAASTAGDAFGATQVEVFALSTALSIHDLDAVDRTLPDIEAQLTRLGDPWLRGVFEEMGAELGYARGDCEMQLRRAANIRGLLASGPMGDLFGGWVRSICAFVAGQIGEHHLALDIIRGRDAEGEDASAHVLMQGNLCSAAAQAGEVAAAWEAAEALLAFVERHPPNKRYFAEGMVHAGRGLVHLARATPPDASRRKLLGRLLARAARIAKGLPQQEVVAGALLGWEALLDGDSARARRRLAPALARVDAWGAVRSVAAAEALHCAAAASGGAASIEGRRSLEAAWAQLAEADDAHWLKRRVAGELGHPLPAPDTAGMVARMRGLVSSVR